MKKSIYDFIIVSVILILVGYAIFGDFRQATEKCKNLCTVWNCK